MSKTNASDLKRFRAEADCTLRHAKATAGALAQMLESRAGLDVDCSGVEQADITFVQTLIAAQRSCAASGVPFSLSGMSDVVASAFQRAGVTPPGSMPSELSGI
jgi:phospholipid transport system transporter-binding protein